MDKSARQKFIIRLRFKVKILLKRLQSFHDRHIRLISGSTQPLPPFTGVGSMSTFVWSYKTTSSSTWEVFLSSVTDMLKFQNIASAANVGRSNVDGTRWVIQLQAFIASLCVKKKTTCWSSICRASLHHTLCAKAGL